MRATSEPDPEVFVGMASVGTRQHMLRGAVESLIGQVDRMGVYLNHYDEIPEFLIHPRITVSRSQDHGDVRDNGKFSFLDDCQHRLYASVDDDILYPPDYVQCLKERLAVAGPMAAVGVHGAVYPTQVVGLFGPRHLYHFARSLPYVLPVHVLGTGTVLFDQAEWRLRYDEFGEPGMADLWFARAARQRDARMFTVNRDRGWLTPIDPADEEARDISTLFDEADVDDSPQARLLHEIDVSRGGFGALVTALAASDRFTDDLTLSQVLALDELRRALGWPPLDASTSAMLTSRLLECRSYWLADDNCTGIDVAAYSRAAAEFLAHDVAASTVIGAFDALDRGAELTKTDRERWRELPFALRFDSRQSRVERVKAVLLDQGMRRSPADAHALWPVLRERADVPVDLAVEAERGGQDTQLPHLPSLALAAGKDPLGAALELREYLEIRQWSVTPDALAWKRVFGPAFPNKEVQLLLAVSAIRSGYPEMANRLMWSMRHRWPDDLDVRLLEALLAAQRYVEPAGALRPTLAALDRTLEEVGVAPFTDFASSSSGRTVHWIHSLDPTFGSRSSTSSPSGLPRVTAIMTVHNDVTTVEAAARSVLSATDVQIELILIDDASTDGTAKVLEQLNDPRLKLIQNETNLGPYVSRNRGLQQATGDFITFADGDDWSHPNRFAYQVARLRDQPDVVGCTVAHVRVLADGHVDLENNLQFVGHGPVSLMFRRSLLDHVGGFDHVRTRGDIEFIRRIRARFGDAAIATFEVPLILATASPTSNSKRFSAEALRRYRRAMRRWHSKFALSDALHVDVAGNRRASFLAPDELVVLVGGADGEE